MTGHSNRFDTPSLCLSGVSAIRGGRTLFEGLTLKLNQPGVVWIKGPNGIGKTTLLKICAGLARPDAGTMRWTQSDKDISAVNICAFAPLTSFAKPTLTLEENYNFWCKFRGLETGHHLSELGLDNHRNTPAKGLSAGQSRRLALALMRAANRPVWILDEPQTGLDQAGRDALTPILTQHIQSGGLIIMASHDALILSGIHETTLTLGVSA